MKKLSLRLQKQMEGFKRQSPRERYHPAAAQYRFYRPVLSGTNAISSWTGTLATKHKKGFRWRLPTADCFWGGKGEAGRCRRTLGRDAFAAAAVDLIRQVKQTPVMPRRLLPVHTQPLWKNIHSSCQLLQAAVTILNDCGKGGWWVCVCGGWRSSSPLFGQRTVSFSKLSRPTWSREERTKNKGVNLWRQKTLLCAPKKKKVPTTRSLCVTKHVVDALSARAFVRLWWLFETVRFLLERYDTSGRANWMDNRRIKVQHPDEALALKRNSLSSCYPAALHYQLFHNDGG